MLVLRRERRPMHRFQGQTKPIQQLFEFITTYSSLILARFLPCGPGQEIDGGQTPQLTPAYGDVHPPPKAGHTRIKAQLSKSNRTIMIQISQITFVHYEIANKRVPCLPPGPFPVREGAGGVNVMCMAMHWGSGGGQGVMDDLFDNNNH